MALFAPPVRKHDGRKSLRSLADALEKLRELDGLADDESVIVKTWALELFDKRRAGTVAVMRPRRSDGSIFVALMPPSGQFVARTTLGERVTFPIYELNDAKSDPEGNVKLANGAHVHSVDLKPVPFYESSKKDDAIVRLAIKCIGAEDRTYRAFGDELFPGLRLLDSQLVARVRIPHVARVQRYVIKRHAGLTPSAVASALRRAGMRFPRQ